MPFKIKIFEFFMNRAYLLTGGNLGDREHYLATARTFIREQCGTILRVSSLYETAAWGNTDQPPFLNQAIEISTSRNARQLMRHILKVEKLMGRVRKEKYGPRLIDIDILLFNDEIKYETTCSEYVLSPAGDFDRNSLLTTDGQNLRLRFRDALQVSAGECLVPSEFRNKLRLVLLRF